jgi:hypothetical protein
VPGGEVSAPSLLRSPGLPHRQLAWAGTAFVTGYSRRTAAPGTDPLDSIDRLALRMSTLCSEAFDPLSIVAGLEAEGHNDRLAQEQHGLPDLFALAEELYRRVPHGGQAQDGQADGRGPIRLSDSIARPLLRGSLFTIPALCGLALLPAAGHTGPTLRLGMAAIQIVAWGYGQGIAHAAYARLNADDQPAARHLLRRATLYALAGEIGLFVLLTVITGSSPGLLLPTATALGYCLASVPALVLGAELRLAAVLAPVGLAALARAIGLHASWGGAWVAAFAATAVFGTLWLALQITRPAARPGPPHTRARLGPTLISRVRSAQPRFGSSYLGGGFGPALIGWLRSVRLRLRLAYPRDGLGPAVIRRLRSVRSRLGPAHPRGGFSSAVIRWQRSAQPRLEPAYPRDGLGSAPIRRPRSVRSSPEPACPRDGLGSALTRWQRSIRSWLKAAHPRGGFRSVLIRWLRSIRSWLRLAYPRDGLRSALIRRLRSIWSWLEAAYPRDGLRSALIRRLRSIRSWLRLAHHRGGFGSALIRQQRSAQPQLEPAHPRGGFGSALIRQQRSAQPQLEPAHPRGGFGSALSRRLRSTQPRHGLAAQVQVRAERRIRIRLLGRSRSRPAPAHSAAAQRQPWAAGPMPQALYGSCVGVWLLLVLVGPVGDGSTGRLHAAAALTLGMGAAEWHYAWYRQSMRRSLAANHELGGFARRAVVVLSLALARQALTTAALAVLFYAWLDRHTGGLGFYLFAMALSPGLLAATVVRTVAARGLLALTASAVAATAFVQLSGGIRAAALIALGYTVALSVTAARMSTRPWGNL